jgi:uncharacterized membrane protein YfcA
MDEQVHWRGAGRWLSFAIAGLFLLAAIPDFAGDAPGAGWNIFLGLLLFAVMAAGSRRAPLLLLVFLWLTVLRVVLAFIGGHFGLGDAVLNFIVLTGLFVAWLDLRKQSASMNENVRPQAS